MVRVAIYVRVSTAEQEAGSQLEGLESLAKARGWRVVAVYREEASAWKAGHQHELAKLKADAGRRKFDAVMVWSLDRLSREGSTAILVMMAWFNAYGVRIYSYQEPWTEAPGPMAEIMFAIVGWVARMESERRSERTRAGMAYARMHGTRSGIGIGKRGRDKKKRKRRIR